MERGCSLAQAGQAIKVVSLRPRRHQKLPSKGHGQALSVRSIPISPRLRSALVIDPDMHGRLINTSGITSTASLRNVDLHVIVNGSNAVLAGTDEVGNTITFEGTIDTTGRVLTLNYVTNGSASGKCESDDGTAYLEKQ